jgi:hypothetical protein
MEASVTVESLLDKVQGIRREKHSYGMRRGSPERRKGGAPGRSRPFPRIRMSPPPSKKSSLLVWPAHRPDTAPLFPAVGAPRQGLTRFPRNCS